MGDQPSSATPVAPRRMSSTATTRTHTRTSRRAAARFRWSTRRAQGDPHAADDRPPPQPAGKEAGRGDHPTAADGETAQGYSSVDEGLVALVEGISGDLRVEVVGPEG